ncbi:glycoside hydrolase [Mucilaginibacter ginkgonis]|uniref:Uncharacterized protein n=1 Tax=Mucilaginibacter ginkgonis TaxID=2682091 RepID=A0A6I4HZI0_9SPHI|nr:glycoside hydrolase [Mucilaginibacter ginkgonis]QQL48678.1 hypothetical protein GO620_010855 [Mucilaginibacter ginkgonis]
MITKKMTFLVAIFATVVLSAFAIFAALDGKWVGTTNMDGNDLALTYNFKVDGDKLTGTAESPYGVSTIDNGKVSGDMINFSTVVNGLEIPQKGKVYADSVVMNIDVNGNILHATLKRPK